MSKIDSNHIFAALGIVLLVIFVSGCSSSDSTTYSGPTKVYSWQGVTFNIPSSWEANETNSQYLSRVFLYDPQKSKSQGVLVMKITLTNESSIMGKQTIQDYVNSQINYSKKGDSFVSTRNFTVNGVSAYEVITSPGGENTRMVSVYIEPKTGQDYVITILDTPQNVEQWRQYLNLVLNSFKVQ